MEKTLNINSNDLVSTDVAFPCGLIALTYNSDEISTTYFTINKNDISWERDHRKNFIYNSQFTEYMWTLYTEDSFINWMRISPNVKNRKYIGKIEGGI